MKEAMDVASGGKRVVRRQQKFEHRLSRIWFVGSWLSLNGLDKI
jgi:hypothetical protein